MEKKELSVIVPVFNEEDAIGNVIDSLARILQKNDISYEIVVVDDGSTDRTPQIAKNKSIVYIRNPVTIGYGASIKVGILKSKYNNIGIIDGDGSYPVEDMLSLFQYIEEFDMVVGARSGQFYRGSLIKYLSRNVFSWLCIYVTGTYIPDANSGLRIFRKETILKYINSICAGFSFTTTLTLLFLLNYHLVKFISIKYYRRVGKSKVYPVRDTLRSFQILLEMIIIYNPLKFYLPMVVLSFLLCLIFFILSIPGHRDYLFLAISMLSLTLILFALGSIAILLSRRNKNQ